MTPESTAEKVLDAHWDGCIPLDLAALARSLGVALANAALPDSKVAAYETVGGPAIHVSKDDLQIRRRFAVAHALGHHVLGHGARRCGAADYSTEAPWQERQANRFALALLMPKSAIEMLLKTDFKTVEALSRTLQVSEVALVARLRDLRIVGANRSQARVVRV